MRTVLSRLTPDEQLKDAVKWMQEKQDELHQMRSGGWPTETLPYEPLYDALDNVWVAQERLRNYNILNTLIYPFGMCHFGPGTLSNVELLAAVRLIAAEVYR